MKYVTTIPNKAALDAGLLESKVDLLDLAILDYLQAFLATGKMKTWEDAGFAWFWVDYRTISGQLPLLRLQSQAIYKRLQKLEDAGLVEFHPRCRDKSMLKPYYRFLDKANSLLFDGSGGSSHGMKQTGRLIPRDEAGSSDGMKQSPRFIPSDEGGSSRGMKEVHPVGSTYYNIIDKDIKDKESCPSSDGQDVSESEVKKTAGSKPINDNGGKVLVLWQEFYKRQAGVDAPPPVNFKNQGAAANYIARYFIKEYGKGDAEKGMKAWERFLAVWDKLDPFHRKQLSLESIKNRLGELIAMLAKNGRPQADPDAEALRLKREQERREWAERMRTEDE